MICNPQFNYNQYYLSQQLSSSHYHAAMGNDMNSNMQQGQSPQPHINSDPSLQLYYSGYDSFQNGQHQNQQLPSLMIPQQPPMNVVAHSPHSSSSQASDYAGTPTLDVPNGSISISRKRSRVDDDDEDHSPITEIVEGKVKATRGSRACTVCRRLKMKCVGAEQGPPCKRCEAGNHKCIFEESNRGKRSSNNTNVKKHEQLTRSLRKMEKTLDTVLRSMGNPGLSSIASGMVSRSPSPSSRYGLDQVSSGSPSSSPRHASSLSAAQRLLGSPRLHSLPDNELNPLGLLAEASLANRRAQNQNKPQADHSPLARGNNVGVANDVYFKPGPMTILPLRRLYIERQVQPEMLSFVSTEEVVALFSIFFDHLNIHIGILDRDFHTPSLVCSRSPFLLTTICAISSKFYDTSPDLHPRLTALARKLAFSVPEQGYKSVEIVQAYILLALWGCGPVERFEQDKTWLLLGMGIRMATDLNLHRRTATTAQDTPEGRARDMEVHNRERTWLICYILDRSMSAQMGKPHSIKEDHIIQNTTLFWTKYNALQSDVGIAAYADLQRILSRSLDLLYSSTNSASGLHENCNYYLVTNTVEAQLQSWHTEWRNKLGERIDTLPSVTAVYWDSIEKFYFNYAMLVVNSFGLQDALEKSSVDIGHFFSRCHSAAVSCATIVKDELGPRGFLRYSPDSHFVQCSYALLSLLKFTRPAFRSFIVNEKSTLDLIQEVAVLLERIAAGPLHTPALYSTLLRALVSVQNAVQNDSSDPSHPDHNAGNQDHPGDRVTLHATGDQFRNGMDVNLGFLGSGRLDGPTTPLGFQVNSEMGPVADMSTFPPTMAPTDPNSDVSGMLPMDSILSTDFWDSVLVPGKAHLSFTPKNLNRSQTMPMAPGYSNSLEGLSGGFVYGAGGSGLITPRITSPQVSGHNTPTQRDGSTLENDMGLVEKSLKNESTVTE